ncbi:hypothetical protein BB558_006025 [Smittium angustum]|uniref:Uncharacterized protein n=1 Tax=Smittium angustum TaxID=133377 RepID=A0A2U1IYU4_SMIAN|nr:hypothetical protein BB558_006025 [Smittium angustum]
MGIKLNTHTAKKEKQLLEARQQVIDFSSIGIHIKELSRGFSQMKNPCHQQQTATSNIDPAAACIPVVVKRRSIEAIPSTVVGTKKQTIIKTAGSDQTTIQIVDTDPRTTNIDQIIRPALAKTVVRGFKWAKKRIKADRLSIRWDISKKFLIGEKFGKNEKITKKFRKTKNTKKNFVDILQVPGKNFEPIGGRKIFYFKNGFRTHQNVENNKKNIISITTKNFWDRSDKVTKKLLVLKKSTTQNSPAANKTKIGTPMPTRQEHMVPSNFKRVISNTIHKTVTAYTEEGIRSSESPPGSHQRHGSRIFGVGDHTGGPGHGHNIRVTDFCQGGNNQDFSALDIT